MKGTRAFAMILICAMLGAALAACGGGGAEPTPAGGAPAQESRGADPYAELGEYTMTVAHAQPEGNPRSVSLLRFAADVEDATYGHVKVEIVGDSKLGSEREQLEQVMAGIIQGMRGGQFDFTPRLLMFTLPFLTSDRAQMDALLESDLAKEICAEAGKTTGTVILNLCGGSGYRQLSNNVRPIKKPEDLKGLRMRTNTMETTAMAFEAMGATAESIPYADLYISLQTNVVDGQDNPWINVRDLELYNVQKYFTEVNYQFHPDPFYVNAKWWKALPKEFQDILADCAGKMGKYNDQLVDEGTQAAKEDILSSGATIYVPTESEMDAFRAAMEPVYEQYVKKGICTAEELAELQRIVSEAD